MSTGGRALVVLLPGLGLPGYTARTATAVAARGLGCVVLDLPGFGWGRPLAARPNIHAVGLAAARWIEVVAPRGPVVVFGHSTGAQAALVAALALEGRRPHLALVMAGPTFAPPLRHWPRLVATTPFAYRSDTPGEIHVGELLRARLDVLAMLRSGMCDAPERRIARLTAPVTLTAGEHDAYARVEWLDQLAGAAIRATHTRTSMLHGSHNNLWTHADEVAQLVAEAATDAAVR